MFLSDFLNVSKMDFSQDLFFVNSSHCGAVRAFFSFKHIKSKTNKNNVIKHILLVAYKKCR
jgi:hypothetical protein